MDPEWEDADPEGRGRRLRGDRQRLEGMGRLLGRGRLTGEGRRRGQVFSTSTSTTTQPPTSAPHRRLAAASHACMRLFLPTYLPAASPSTSIPDCAP
eukprot:363858-Chlamydomonas_euryale.AAC.4